MVFHWHGDTFDLPSGATPLASSAACARQAYSMGPNVLALQFHPEISAPTIDRWVQESNTVKHPKGYVMGGAEMKRLAPTYLPPLKAALDAMLDRFFTE
jgi:GMP synthase (glutamine-hydrolysing)